jgi:hypothetical protein
MHISASDPALCNLAIFAQPHEKVSEGVCKVHQPPWYWSLRLQVSKIVTDNRCVIAKTAPNGILVRLGGQQRDRIFSNGATCSTLFAPSE